MVRPRGHSILLRQLKLTKAVNVKVLKKYCWGKNIFGI